ATRHTPSLHDALPILAESGFGGFPSGSPGPVLSRDTSGHGTAVAGIAAGNGRGSEGRQYRGAAPEAELIIVKMGTPRPDGFPRTDRKSTRLNSSHVSI